MHVLATISTPWAPYSVMFSHDGSRIAIGGGTWYGDGGIILASLLTGETQRFRCADLPRAPQEWIPAASGVCFSADDSLLAASTRSARLHYSPTFLFDVAGLRISHRDTFVHHYEDRLSDPCPTGVILHGGYLITRNNTTTLTDVFVAWDLPPGLTEGAGDPAHHLTHTQIAVVRGTAISGGGGSLKLGGWRSDTGDFEWGKAAGGLVFATLASEVPRVWALPVDSCRRITAIAATSLCEGFITGGLDGELDEWSWKGMWAREGLRSRTAEKTAATGLAWATYTPNSVIGICSLSDARRWVSVDASGEVQVWTDRTPLRPWQLPVFGSPRALAAHWSCTPRGAGGRPSPFARSLERRSVG